MGPKLQIWSLTVSHSDISMVCYFLFGTIASLSNKPHLFIHGIHIPTDMEHFFSSWLGLKVLAIESANRGTAEQLQQRQSTQQADFALIEDQRDAFTHALKNFV